MKKIFSLLFAVCFVVFAVFAVTACDETTSETPEEPIKFSYSLVKEDDATYYSLKSVTISEAAKKLVDKNDYEALAELFNTSIDGVYTAPETKYTKDTVRTVVIPAEYNKKPVKAISADAISGLVFVKKIVVGENIDKIAEGAFSSLGSLEEIELPFVGGEYNAKNEKKLFGYIFGTTSGDDLNACDQVYNEGESGNTKTYQIPYTLKTVTVTKGNEKSTKELTYKIDGDKYVYSTDDGYADLEGDEHVIKKVDDSKYAVAAYSFYGCTTIETVNLSGITEIEPYTFYGCASITTLNCEGLTKIGDSAFETCTALKSFDFTGIEKVGKAAFKDCTALGGNYADKANDVVIPETLTEEIGESAFEGCSGIITLKIKSAADIGKYAFKSLTSLKNLYFETAGTKIGYAAFYGCTAVEAIDLANVTELGDYAFYGCKKLKTVENLGNLYAEHAFDETEYSK
ncbi:MAG: leucine-rich repeat domain-containing protein [Clostridia bacterium]|nr:leucine-rich repeat domain-containing protein [Clostridia bacterium]